MTNARRWERAAGAMSIGAGLVHGGLGPEHFAAWWGYGAFFVAAAAAQLVLGLALVTDAVDPRHAGIDVARTKRWLYGVGCAGQLVLIVFYVVTRTAGIPWLGPEAGVIESVAPIDIIAKLLETGCAIVLAGLAFRASDPASAPKTG